LLSPSHWKETGHFFAKLFCYQGVSIYSNSGNGAGISISEATQVIEELVKDFDHHPPILSKDSAVMVLPNVVASDQVSGAVFNGKSYLFLDQITDSHTDVVTLWHELLHEACGV
jgi:hypothetical protein